MKISDYIAKRLKKETDFIFGVTGGAVVNLIDSIYKYGPKFIPLHHEQACAMAADSYARISGKLGVVISTSGPGATNLLTGICCSYFDSIPVLAISGQVPTKDLKKNHNPNLRQFGFQETDCVSIFKSSTKLSKLFDSLDEVILEAKSLRKGPVFVEIPDDVQRKKAKLKKKTKKISIPKVKNREIIQIKKMLSKAKRPILILGAGVDRNYAKLAVHKFNIPCLLTWGAIDYLPDEYMHNLRDFGVTGQRAGNLAVWNSDLIIAIGTRLDTHEIPDLSKIKGKKIVIDIDKYELDKLSADLKILSDSTYFIRKFPYIRKEYPSWEKALFNLKDKFDKKKINKIIEDISKISKKGDIIITDAGQTLTWTMQSWKIKYGQRLFSAFNHSPMGYSVPASIGAYYASKKKIICFTGDGGLQMNLQELQSIGLRKLPIKIFVINNKGYGMIRQTQSDWDNLLDGAATYPPMAKLKEIARTFGFKYYSYKTDLRKVLSSNYPCLIEIKINENSKIAPKLKYGDELWNQVPYLNLDKTNEILKKIK